MTNATEFLATPAVLGCRDKVWTCSRRWRRWNIIDEQTGDLMGSVEVVIVRTSPVVVAGGKWLAIVPLSDIVNEQFGGVMLLRVPTESLRDMCDYSNNLTAQDRTYYSIGTRIEFDMNVPYPKFIFTAIRVLTCDEMLQVIAFRAGRHAGRILNEANALDGLL
jgi:hypothetical protein